MSHHHKRARKVNTDTHLFIATPASHVPHTNCCFHGSFFQPKEMQMREQQGFRRPVRNMGVPHFHVMR